MDLESEYEQILNSFGKENIRIEYLDDTDDINFDEPDLLDIISKSFSKVQVTHIPTGKICKGVKYGSQLENVVYALKQIKRETK
ncbi:hypothetical protein [Flagellimonas beolgyonensis]|uniref:hypothetical protein n=1 Tax=Flagellimonas beolgyonensis TaxID=864064 RepID=UPI003D65F789